MAAGRALLPRRRAREPADPARRRRRHLRRQCRRQDHLRQSGGRTHAGLHGRRAGRQGHALDGASHPSRRLALSGDRTVRSTPRSATARCIRSTTKCSGARTAARFCVEYTSTPIRDRGALIGAVIVFRDITQRREADEKLRAALAEVDQLRKRLELDNEYLQEEIRMQTNHRGIIGISAAIQKTLRQIELVAPTEASVLITGESGTGKELIARAIHDASKRSHRPLIRVNCAAMPRDLFESEFFGHAKGALGRRVARPAGTFRTGRWRHAVPRRDRRHPARIAGQAAARAAGGPIRARRRSAHPSCRRARDRRDQPRSRRSPCARSASARTCISGSTYFRSIACRCASAPTTFRCSRSICSRRQQTS